ncbi:MAG: thiamine pyrophosphate-binding protein, partial [Actinomycetia bacterium]|nr:thiamine pyrophosphate-binding protein [Actinomycetes bacterium]
APITTSFGGRSAVDSRLPNVVPMLPPLIDDVRNEADVVLALGTRFGETDWWGKPPYWRSPDEQKLIHVDIDDEILGVNKPVDVAVLGDIGLFVDALLEELSSHSDDDVLAARAERLDSIAAERDGIREFLLAVTGSTDDEGPVHSAHAAIVCREIFDDDAVLVIDGGNTAVWTNLYHENRVPGSLLSTFKFGMLGAGIGQALGAKVAHPDRQVYCILGD